MRGGSDPLAAFNFGNLNAGAEPSETNPKVDVRFALIFFGNTKGGAGSSDISGFALHDFPEEGGNVAAEDGSGIAGAASRPGVTSSELTARVSSLGEVSRIIGFNSKVWSVAPQSGQKANLSANPASHELQYFNFFDISTSLRQ